MFNIRVSFQHFLPQHLLSQLVGFIAHCRFKWLKNRLIIWFVKKYDVDIKEAFEDNPLNYSTFNAFFTRKLKEDVRQVSEGNVIVSPVDGVISQMGDIENNLLIQAKGFQYSLSDLLAGKYVEDFTDGLFVTLYLSPRDYHRVHMPLTGVLKEMIYIPGKLFSVNRQTTTSIPNVFTRNERIVCIFDTEIGLVAVIMIGAMLVGGMHTTWFGRVTPCKNHQLSRWQYSNQSVNLICGMEMGHFEFGSTVIVLTQHKRVSWHQRDNMAVKMGQSLGAMLG